MKRTRPDSNIRVMIFSECEEHEKEIVQIESAESHEGYKPLFLVEYGGNTEAELRSQFYEEFQEGFQKDEIELMGRKCSEWNSIFHEWTQIEFYQKEQAELKEEIKSISRMLDEAMFDYLTVFYDADKEKAKENLNNYRKQLENRVKNNG